MEFICYLFRSKKAEQVQKKDPKQDVGQKRMANTLIKYFKPIDKPAQV